SGSSPAGSPSATPRSAPRSSASPPATASPRCARPPSAPSAVRRSSAPPALAGAADGPHVPPHGSGIKSCIRILLGGRCLRRAQPASDPPGNVRRALIGLTGRRPAGAALHAGDELPLLGVAVAVLDGRGAFIVTLPVRER